MKIRLGQVVLLVFFFAAPAFAEPVVITFSSGPPISSDLVPSYTEAGFTFCCNFRIFENADTGNFAISNNSFHISNPNSIFISFNGGGQFDFLGVDRLFGVGRDVFVGSNGVVIDFDDDRGVDFGTVFRGITLVEWQHFGVGGEPGPAPVEMDNFRFNTYPDTPVPEPATLILLGAGLLGVLKATKKRKVTSAD